MTYDEAVEEHNRCLNEAKALIKQAAEIGSIHGINVSWNWKNIYNNYVYIFETGYEPNNQMDFDFGC